LRREEKECRASGADGKCGRDSSGPGQREADHTAAAGQEQCLSGRRARAIIVQVAPAAPNNKRANIDDVGSEGVEDAKGDPTYAEGRGGHGISTQQRSLDEASSFLHGEDQCLR
jgi:hypothetical protein